jgi:integrase
LIPLATIYIWFGVHGNIKKETKKMNYQNVELDEVFREFVNSKKQHTKWSYSTYLKQWILFSGMNGAETLAFKQNDTEAKTEAKVMEFRQWLVKGGAAETSAQTAVGCVRGFFARKRLPLHFISSEKKTLSQVSRKTEDYLFTKEDLAKMSAQASPIENYVLLVGKSVGLRVGDFLNLTFGKFRAAHLDGDAPIFLGETVTTKEHVKAYPFLDSDAIPMVKAILERNPTAKNEDKILDYNEHSLTQMIQRLFKKANLESGSKIVRFHNLRKYLCDRLSAVASESQWKQIVGKKIAESAYMSQDQLCGIFSRAMPSIVVLNGGNRNHVKIEQLEDKISALEQIVEFALPKDRLVDAIVSIIQKRQIKGEIDTKLQEIGYIGKSTRILETSLMSKPYSELIQIFGEVKQQREKVTLEPIE